MISGLDDGRWGLYVWEQGNQQALAEATPSRHNTVSAAQRHAETLASRG